MEADCPPEDLARSISLATARFIHIPGPNPLLTPGPPDSWDDGVIEACDVIKDEDTYYWYYHGTSHATGYQIGVATAPHPLGPWTKHEGNPVLPLGPEGSWEDQHVACAFVIRESVDRYLMWYSALASRDGAKWSIGLATAPSPLGPWEKHAGNPILEDFGYVGGVVRVEGKYHLYAEHPIGSTGADYGPMSLATADSPEGPWTRHPEPVLRQGEWGEWDDGGFSEAKVLHRDGLFHLFYGGAKLHPTRIRSQESIGYAYSLDGVHFTKHPWNPVAPREATPDAAAFAEVHALLEPPFVYLYHTLRYYSRHGAEDLGIQVLALSRPFRLPVSLLAVDSVLAGQAISLDDCPPLCLAQVESVALTVECGFALQAKAGIRIHVRSSYDGLRWDTNDLDTFELPCLPGQAARQTFGVTDKPMFAKVLVHNLDEERAVRNVRVTATVGG